MELKSILDQIDSVLSKYENARKRSKYDDCSDLPHNEMIELITLLDATIDRLAPAKSRYRENTRSIMKTFGETNGYNIKCLVGIIKALRSDYDSGYMQSVQELIHADMFSDFIEMAEYLLSEGYKDPSAVMVGSVLEEHLRKLCQKQGIPVEETGRPKKADRLNSELASNDVYSKLNQKNVIAWLGLRNKAAHGKYDEYSKEQVTLMVQGVRDFITRFPA